MSLLQMSFSGAVMIIAILLVRMVAINKLPKMVFVVLWEIAFLRLLIPISVPSVFSAYSMVRENHITQEVFTEGPVSYLIPEAQEVQFAVPALIPETQEIQSAVPALIPETQEVQSVVPALIPEAQEIQSAVSANMIEAVQHEISAVPGETPLPLWTVLWIAGMIICALFFLITYLRCYREFRMSLPVSNAFAEEWLKGHQIKRGIRIRQSDRISSPLTYGIFRPVILMPKTTDWEDLQRLQYILQHEYVHIRRFDMIRKLAAALVLCIHWFNPAVWLMYLIYNRDIELSCDESVIREFGESSKPLYAKALIAMEEKRNSLQPLSNSFSKNAIEERIKAVMKTKKVTVWAAIISIAVIAVIAVVFATSANTAERDEQVSANLAGENIFSFSGDQYFPLFEGEWVAVEYVGDTNDSLPNESYTEEYWADQEEKINEIIEEYLGSEYRIEIDNMKYFCPITELGYILENDDDLFFCTRFAYLDFPMTPPYIGACVYLLDKDETYNLIIDNNGTLLIQIKYTFFRLERKSETENQIQLIIDDEISGNNGSHDPVTTADPIGTEYTEEIDGISLSEYIEKYVTLTDDTEIEGWEILDHNGENILRIQVGYNQDDLRGTIQGHKEDYFIFLNGNGEAGYVLQVGYEDKTLGYVCDYSAHFEDVTFDGNDDLLIYLGDGRYSPHYCAFIYENGQYRYEKSFEDIPYYELDMENQVIRAYDGMNATEEADYIFEYKNGEFVLTEENIHRRGE